MGRMVAGGDYQLAASTEQVLLDHFEAIGSGPSFGNAREARRLFEAARKAQSQRLRLLGRMPDTTELRTLLAEDIATAAVYLRSATA
jgi:hypothetical protein